MRAELRQLNQQGCPCVNRTVPTEGRSPTPCRRRRVAPSAKLAKAAEDLVASVDREAGGIQEALEQEQADHLDRGRYARREAAH